MNILFFQDTLGVSGGEIWVSDAALKLQQRGHHVVIGCPSGSWMERQAEARGIPFFDYLIDPEFESNLRWQLVDCLQDHQIDLIVCGIPGFRIEAPILDSAVREVGRGSIVLRLGVTPGPGALSPERIGLDMETVRGIIVVSDDIGHHLRKEFPTLSAERIHVFYNGVDLEKFAPERFTPADRRAVRCQLDIPENHLVIGTVGRLDPVKNLPMLIQSAGRILSKHPETTFLVVGEGSEKQALVQTAKEAGVLENFRFAGFVEDIPRLLYSLDILVHTSISEGIPNAVLEAMALAKPVVATDVGGVSELVEHQKSGILTPLNDVAGLSEELSHLLEVSEARASLGRAARHRVETHFDRQSRLDGLEKLLMSEADRAGQRKEWSLEGTPELENLPDLYFSQGCTLQKVHV